MTRTVSQSLTRVNVELPEIKARESLSCEGIEGERVKTDPNELTDEVRRHVFGTAPVVAYERCAVGGCAMKPRHGLRTCWPHARYEA